MKYNFHIWKDKIKANPSLALPADINDPAYAMLRDIGCDIAQEELKDAQKCVAYEEIRLVNDATPHAYIDVEIENGMVHQWYKWRMVRKEPWTMYVTRSIKNANVDKRKPKEGQNARTDGRHD
jgi:hypothetical protein